MMVKKDRLLSKSRFKEAWECPTRLYYTGKHEYATTTEDDPFLRSLAEGGFQVGALAQCYHPGGELVETLDTEQAELETRALMKRPEVTIFEGAVKDGYLLARVDILVKRGRKVSLIEVKSKSFDTREGTLFKRRPSRDGKLALDSDWAPYLADVGFQTLVFSRAYPELEVTPYLMLADKSRTASVDGLHQKFLLQTDANGRSKAVVVGSTGQDALGDPVLGLVDVSREVAALEPLPPDGTAFASRVDQLATAYHDDIRLPSPLGCICRRCPYRAAQASEQKDKRSGFDECWTTSLGLTAEALRAKPLALDMGRLKVEELLAEGTIYLEDVPQSAIAPKADGEAGLSFSERRWLQVTKLKGGDDSIFIDRQGLADEMASWVYPLHMIDFETMTVAIPFYRGARPYEQIAFQFSHHLLSADGSIAHQTEWIETAPGAFPNFSFVRALRDALGPQGTILRYSPHENTVLCQILAQMDNSEDPPSDHDELAAWIRTVTHSPGKSETAWRGKRDMVDMLEMVKRYDYHPATLGSNSLKYVLPAVLDSSRYLQEKYKHPIYGARDGIKSHNFVDMAWVHIDNAGKVRDPYKLLEPVYGIDLPENSNLIFAGEELRNGGAAMTAFERMQFMQMTDEERRRLRGALLRYCELDTFAMVMLYEYWKQAAF